MYKKVYIISVLLVLFGELCAGQVLQFGTCAEVKTMQYFDFERFLGEWYEIERFPTWYEQYGSCAYKRFQYCARRVEIEHIYVRDGIQFILHVNSTYTPGDEAVFAIPDTNIDPLGIPLSVISTDYVSYAVVYGCKNDNELGIKYISAWILSRTSSLPEDYLKKAYQELNSTPFASVAYLEKVEQRENMCTYHWTAHIHAQNITEAVRNQMLLDNDLFNPI